MGRLTHVMLVGLLAGLAGAGLASQARAQSPGGPAVPDTPAPTEQLSQISLPQQSSEDATVFDIYIGDKFKGSTIVTFTDQWFEVDDPADAVSQLADVESGKDKLVELLSGRIERERSIEGVGRVSYDLSTFRLVIVPDSSLMKGTSLDLSRRLGKPESGFSLQQGLGVAAVKQKDGPTNSAFTHRSLASYDDYFLRLDGAAVEGQQYRLYQATAGTLYDEYQTRLGLLQMRGQPFVSTLSFAGLQLDTAEELFIDDDLARGSKLEVFISSRSTVQFYRDGQLLSVQVLDFGLQEINTKGFPQGSYDVDIVITDSSGRETRERRFFTKAGFLATRARPIVSFSAGVVRDQYLVDVYDTPLVQGALRSRLTDIMDVGISAAATNENSVGNVTINGLYRELQFGSALGWSPGGDYGISGNLGVSLFGFGINGRVTTAEGRYDNEIPVATPTPNVPSYIPENTNPNRELFIRTQENRSISVGRGFGPVDIRYVNQSNKIENDIRRFSNTTTATWRIYEDRPHSFSAIAAYGETEIGLFKSGQFFYRVLLTPEWSLNAQLLRRWQVDNDESLALVGVQYDSLSGFSSRGVRMSGYGEARKLNTNNSSIGGVNADVVGTYARTQGFFRSGVQNEESLLIGGVNAQSSLLVSNEGHVAVSHPPQSDCIFIAEVVGNAVDPDDEFEVIANGQIKDVIRAGETGVVALLPYNRYKVSIRPKEGAGLVSYDDTEHEFTLFPGNVLKRTWRIDKVFIILGRVVDESGQPVARERIRGVKDYVFTEEDGTFQAEVSGSEHLSIESKRIVCDLDVDLTTPPEYFLDLHDVVCRPRAAQAPQS